MAVFSVFCLVIDLLLSIFGIFFLVGDWNFTWLFLALGQQNSGKGKEPLGVSDEITKIPHVVDTDPKELAILAVLLGPPIFRPAIYILTSGKFQVSR